jgi:hypothetical protein
MRVETTGGGREKYGAKSGKHDDLVLAVALACWVVIKLEAWQAGGPGGVRWGWLCLQKRAGEFAVRLRARAW